jgi:hypothetical protein
MRKAGGRLDRQRALNMLRQALPVQGLIVFIECGHGLGFRKVDARQYSQC